MADVPRVPMLRRSTFSELRKTAPALFPSHQLGELLNVLKVPPNRFSRLAMNYIIILLTGNPDPPFETSRISQKLNSGDTNRWCGRGVGVRLSYGKDALSELYRQSLSARSTKQP